MTRCLITRLTKYWNAHKLKGRYQHLIGTIIQGNKVVALAAVQNEQGDLDVFTRENFKKLREEMQQVGLCGSMIVYCRVSTYIGPNLEFYQEIPEVIS